MSDDGIARAKEAIDVGVMTNDWPAHERTFAELGVVYDHLLKIGGGVHQHRFAAGDSVIKINSHRSTLDASANPLGDIHLVGDTERVDTWTSPDGVAFTVVPPGHEGIRTVRVVWRTADVDVLERFLVGALGARHMPASDRSVLAIGDSQIVIVDDAGATGATGATQLDGLGVRYLTVQVHDVEREHRRIVGLGHTEARPPVRLGDTARISFVTAPDGTWVEISQRASLTGPLD